MTLHILSGNSTDTTRQCLAALAEGDALLLIADGVFAAMTHGPVAGAIAALPAGITMHALRDDCAARGIGAQLQPRVRLADYADFVRLAAAQPRSVSWF